MKAELFEKSKRIVLKIGSALLSDSGRTSYKHIKKYATLISSLKKSGKEVVLVSSGAVASADFTLPEKTSDKNIPLRQALASIGQVNLMNDYRKAFKAHKINVGQILLSEFSLQNRTSYLNARSTIEYLLQLNCVPIINENDPLAVEELKFGDNDMLGALVSGLVDADLYLILSDVDGLYKDYGKKNQELIEHVDRVTPLIRMQAGKANKVGTGGMISKVNAAETACRFGISVIVTSGESKNIFKKLELGEGGTSFKALAGAPRSRKKWIASGLNITNAIVVDDGAANALVGKGASLLPRGIVQVKGRFHIGDICLVENSEGEVLAKGLVSHSSYELQKIAGKNSKEIEGLIGRKSVSETIHKDNLVILK